MKKYLCLILFLTIFIVPSIIHAAFIGPIGNPMCSGLGEYSTKLCNLLWDIQRILYAFSAIIAVIFIIVAGVIYITAGDNEDNVKKARKMITNALIGFAIVLSFSFLIGIVREIITNSLN